MYFPETYLAALCLTILTMICWGSWANTLKLCPGYRFQLFYWDYVIGHGGGRGFLGADGGQHGNAGAAVAGRSGADGAGADALCDCGGAIFNVANLLLVAAIDVAGLAVAFPVGHRAGAGDRRDIELCYQAGRQSRCCCSAAWRWWSWPSYLDAAAYRKREATAKATTARGIVISLACGVLMGCFYPFVAQAH